MVLGVLGPHLVVLWVSSMVLVMFGDPTVLGIDPRSGTHARHVP